MEQGRRPEQVEFSTKASFYCILIAFILAIVFSFVEPMFHKEFESLSLVFKSLALNR